MSNRNFAFIHVGLFLLATICSDNPWPFLMLTIAQLIYVPIALRIIVVKKDWFAKLYKYFATLAYLAIVLLEITSAAKWDVLFAAVYLLFTIVIALYGFSRFFSRGFTSLEEFSIDVGLVYLSLGGAWFFAYIASIDTGFSPLITWLTAIHFHYSAFLLPIFVGLLGRLYKPASYQVFCSMILVAPLIVAIGITFSRWIELLSVLLYIISLSGLISMAWKTPFVRALQKWLVRISFGALGVTIIFSLMYALSNGFGLTSVNIDFMLRFHGVLNCVLFALFGVVGWSLTVPASSFAMPSFPVSQIRGQWMIGEKVLDNKVNKNHPGLVDDMHVYKLATVSPRIIDFYENTTDYRLFATVQWRRWFRPFAFLYTLVSRKTQQINLPFHGREIEMTGDVLALRAGVDGRNHVRAWLRKVDEVTAFVALYSEHTDEGRTYMNIALPLPFATMTGILELNGVDNGLQLTSKKISSPDSDAGIYLSYKANHLFKLPIEEDFIVRELEGGTLRAQHDMWIFSIPFLTINYQIMHNSSPY